jgi:hypothetical protein
MQIVLCPGAATALPALFSLHLLHLQGFAGDGFAVE